MSQYVRETFSAQSGFPEGPVYAITQTRDGYLWVGTGAGLVRFDGSNFRLMQSKTKGMKITQVLGLTPDSDGSLWVRLRRPTLLRYQNGEFENALRRFGAPALSVSAMSLDRERRLLLWALQGEASALVRNGHRFDTLVSPPNLSRSPVLSLAQTPDGVLWIGTRDAGLIRIAGGKASAVRAGLPDLKVNCLLADRNAQLWVGTDRGVVRWNGRNLTQDGIPAALREVRAVAMTADRDQNLWIGTNSEGLLRLDRFGRVTSASLGSKEAVTAVFEDRDGNIWAGSAGSIQRISDSVFVTYSTAEGMPSSSSGAVFVDGKQRTWFAPVGGGLYRMERGQVEPVRLEGLDSDVIYAIAGGGDDLWVGRQRGGLTRLHETNGVFTSRTYTVKDGLAQNSIYAVLPAGDGSVWAGTLSAGVSHWRDGKFTTYSTADGLAASTVTAIEQDRDGTVWFATPLGVSSFSSEGWRRFGEEEGLPSLNVNTLFVDSTGRLWAGTSAGLALWKDPRFQGSKKSPAALRTSIFGLAEDAHGSLWVGTANSVLRVRRESLLAENVQDGDIRAYDQSDGLHNVNVVKRQRSVVTDPNGRIWFSLYQGLSVVDPSRLTSGSAPAFVQVQSVVADGETLDVGGPVRIAAGSSRVVFDYAALVFTSRQKVRFRYRLDPFDRAWSEPSGSREAVYTNLTPGHYRFRVMASNPDGAWNGPETAMAFELLPLFWQTWVFQSAVVIILTGIALALYRMRIRIIAGQMNARFEERLAERTRIAQELHDTLLQGFLSASMQIHMAADRLPEDSPVKPSMNRVIDLMSQVIQEGRNAVRGLRADSGALDLAQAFSRIQDELGMDESVRFRVVVEGQPRPVHPLLRDDIYRIGREALVNAFRHASASSIEVELEYGVTNFRFRVHDDGCGIGEGVLKEGREGHWGLAGMRERAERIGGRLEVWTGSARGTEVELSVPSAVAFQSDPGEGRWRRLFQNRLRRARAGRRSAELRIGNE